jgi:hypothetical protein
VAGASPSVLRSLVPYWFDERYQAEVAAGVLVGTEDTADLVHSLLTIGSANSASAAVAQLLVPHTDSMQKHLVDTLNSEQVRAVAHFLAVAPVGLWMRHHQGELAHRVVAMRIRRPFDDTWAQLVLDDIAELTALFAAAAEAAEAVIVKASA